VDHIDWLLDKSRYIEAMHFAENPTVSKNLHPGVLQDIGIRYTYHLVKCGKFAEAAKKCGETLKERDKQRWEDFIVHFLDHGQLQAILPFIPQKDPQLSPAVYELVLNTFLQEDCKVSPKSVLYATYLLRCNYVWAVTSCKDSRKFDNNLIVALINIWQNLHTFT
jgi:hypothetical protein